VEYPYNCEKRNVMIRMRKDDIVSTMILAAQAIEVLIHEYDKLVFHTIYGFTGDYADPTMSPSPV